MKDAWIQTYTGKQFYPFDPKPDQIDIEDIAHALANVCRFTGHTNQFYSVAEHSVHVSRLVSPEHALQALLHDGSEAFLSDIAAPIKPFLPDYKALEKTVQRAVYYRFGLPYEDHPEVKAADVAMLAAEAKYLMGNPNWAKSLAAAPVGSLGWGPIRAKRMFLQRFRSLYQG